MPSKEYVEHQISSTMSSISKPTSWLCDELRTSRGQVLVLDCRSQAEFQQAHIRGAINVTLPTLMLRRLANGKLSLAAAIKCNEGRDKFSKTWKTSTIVLCDDRCDSTSLPSTGGVLPTLFRRLQQDGCHVVLLEGGFHEFKAQFPEWCRVELVGNDTPVLGLQNLHISSSDSESEEDPCDLSMGRETPFDDSPFPVEILPYLFLGNAKNSADQAALEKYHIKYILNVTPNLPNIFEQDPNIKYMQIPISDHWSQDLASFFPEAIAFIDEARQQQFGVLVHCLAGISRSVTITVAYLMHKLMLPLNDAYDFVKKRKANISPNFNFMGQLLDFERQLNLSPAAPRCMCSSASSLLSSTSSSSASSPDMLGSLTCTPNSATSSGGNLLTPPTMHCHCQRAVMHFITSPTHSSPDSGVEFEGWT